MDNQYLKDVFQDQQKKIEQDRFALLANELSSKGVHGYLDTLKNTFPLVRIIIQHPFEYVYACGKDNEPVFIIGFKLFTEMKTGSSCGLSYEMGYHIIEEDPKLKLS